MGVVKGVIGIKDNATAVLKSVRQEQQSLKKEVEGTRKELSRTWGKKWQAKFETTAALKKTKQLKTSLEPLKKKVTTAIEVKDKATAKIKEAKANLKELGKKVASPVVKLKNSMAPGIRIAKSMLKTAFKAVVVPVTIAATVVNIAVGGAALSAVKSGLELEQQQISMKHFISATNKDMSESAVNKVADSFTKKLRENANATPFETGEVIAAGSRAVAISSGNTKEALRLVKLSEDMAAASGGTKSISDAMEALADAKMGEMERLKEFGFKVSAEEFKEKGFKGVTGNLKDFYGGAAEKLAQSGAGLISTIKGKLKSSVADFGLNIVEKIKPVLRTIIDTIDTAAPHLDKFGTLIAESLGKGVNIASKIIPKFTSAIGSITPIFSSLQQAVVPIVGAIFNSISTILPPLIPVVQEVFATTSSIMMAAAPVIAGLVEGVGTVVSTLAPVFSTVFGSIAAKVGSVISFIGERMGFINEVISTVAPVVSDIISTSWKVIEPVLDIGISTFKLLFSVVQTVFPGIKSVIVSVWNFIKPIVEGIGTVLHGLASGWDWLAGKVAGANTKSPVRPGKNAEGTDNWKGGLTWVGEKGPELVNLPKGAQVIPSRESFKMMSQPKKYKPVMSSVSYSVVQSEAGSGRIVKEVLSAISILKEKLRTIFYKTLPDRPEKPDRPKRPKFTTWHTSQEVYSKPLFHEEGYKVPTQEKTTSNTLQKVEKTVRVTIAKLADSIVVREEADIDKIGTAIAKKIVEATINMA